MAALALLLITGCGGGVGNKTNSDKTYSVEASTTVTTASVAKAGYVRRVNRSCRKAWVEILDNFAETRRLQNPKMAARQRFAEAVQLTLITGIVFYIFDEIQQLGAPPGDEHEVEEMIGVMQSASERGQKRLAPISSVAQVIALYSDYNLQARDYGLVDCLVDEAHLGEIEP